MLVLFLGIASSVVMSHLGDVANAGVSEGASFTAGRGHLGAVHAGFQFGSMASALAAFATGRVGLWLQRLLPEPHTSDRSRDIITAMVGLVFLLLALVLGAIIRSAYAFYSNQKTERETIAARALQLDMSIELRVSMFSGHVESCARALVGLLH
jgi:hypothetical protein